MDKVAKLGLLAGVVPYSEGVGYATCLDCSRAVIVQPDGDGGVKECE